MLFVFSFGLASTFLLGAPRPAYAQYVDPITSIQTTIGNVWETLKEGLVQGAGVAVLNGANYFLQQMAYQAAVALTSDCPGQVVCWDSKSFEAGFEQAWQGAIGEAVGTLSEAGGFDKLGFNLCKPPQLNTEFDFSLNIQLGLMDEVKPPKPKCDWNDLKKNYADAANALTTPKLMAGVKLQFKPGQAPLSAGLAARSQILGDAQDVAAGFQVKSLQEASAGAGFSGITDPVSGRVKSPPGVVAEEFKRSEAEGKGEKAIEQGGQVTAGQLSSKAVIGVITSAISTFAQTLVSRLFNKLVKGLMSTEELVAGQPDIILDREALLQPPGRTQQQQSLQTRFSASRAAPREVGSVDPLLDFTICPSNGRTSQNCVVDSQFANAVRVADATPVTVREAIEKGMLHGDWPLIPSKDQVHDQDPYCYTYAYCESNLKKLRAIRVIPIGWEIAASQSSVAQPIKLKDAMDRFNDCNTLGQLDSTHPYCHLIDPDWVLKMPPVQCKAKVFGPTLLDPSIPTRTEICVDQPSCLRQDDLGACTGGYGYCTRERNVWRFNGDQCPEYFNRCRSLVPKAPSDGTEPKQVNYLLNTIDYGICNADNAGCAAYTTVKNPAGTASDVTDDWLTQPALYFNRNVQKCSASQAGCTSLIKLGRSDSLNLVRNGDFESLEDGDADGNPDHPTGWIAPVGMIPNARTGWVETTGTHASGGTNSVALVAGSVAGDTCSTVQCSSENGCKCAEAGPSGTTGDYTCRVHFGKVSCYYAARLVQDRITLRPNKTHTLTAALKRKTGESANINVTARLTFRQADGTAVSLSTGDATQAALSSETCGVVSGGLQVTQNVAADTATIGCSFSVKRTDVALAMLELTAGGASVFVDNVLLEEGGGTPFHTDYGSAAERIYAKVPPAYLNCQGDEGDRQECENFAGVCRDTEIGCDLYTPKNGDPAVPGITGPQDSCPAECVGYDSFKLQPTEFDSQSTQQFEYFIPTTARACSAAEVGCSEFTNLDTEGVEYYSRLRLCQRPDDTDSKVFYSWEGSDTTGYQLKVWNLKTTGNASRQAVSVANNGTSDICADTSSPSCAGNTAGSAPCTAINAATNTCINVPPGTPPAGYCTRSDIDAGNFDCRELYDADGNRHYRLLSRTILATADCHPYRMTRSTSIDCTQTNGKWDATRLECVYQATGPESSSCGVQANNCRAYKGNAASNVRNDFVDDFESALTKWTDGSGGTGNIEQSPEAITVGGHSLKVKSRIARRDITDFASAGRSYQVSFWARGAGSVTVTMEDAQAAYVCSLTQTCSDSAGCTCSTPDRSCTVPSGQTTCQVCTSPIGCTPPTGNVSVAAGTPPPAFAPTVTLSSNWRQYSIGPVILGSPLWTGNRVRLAFTQASPGSEYYMDNVVLKEVQDNIYVIRDSWQTPASCDRTSQGTPSPLEMLGCREYRNTKNETLTLRSFSSLCRERAVGCAAYSASQSTHDNAHEESFNAVCHYVDPVTRQPTTCKASPSCVCSYDLRLRSSSGAVVADPPVTLYDVCRVPVGESECRFTLGTWDDSSSALQHPDRINVPADERLHLVVKDKNKCTSDAFGCMETGVAQIAYDSQCVYKFPQTDTGDINGDGDRTELVMQPGKCDPSSSAQASRGVCTNAGSKNGKVCANNTVCGGGSTVCTAMTFVVNSENCKCTDTANNVSCTLTKGESGCNLSYETGVISKWKASRIKDDSRQYPKNVCVAPGVGCSEYSSSTGSVFFKDPGTKVCEYKETVTYKDPATGERSERSGWFRKSESGALIPCYSELLKNGDFFEIYKNKDAGCKLGSSCQVDGGCLCTKPGETVPTCKVPKGDIACGFEGWVGECKPEFDRCEEFVDPASTSESNPEGLPYYYIENQKLDTTSCGGTVSLKQGCVLVKQTSKPQNLYSSAASYIKSLKQSDGGRVAPENCDQGTRSTLCENRCYGRRNSKCSNNPDKICSTDDDCGGGKCEGTPYWGTGCVTTSDCNVASGEKCLTPVTSPPVDKAKTANDSNLIVKVKPDRECAQWLTCASYDSIWDEQQSKYRQSCTAFGLCDRAKKTGQTFECGHYVEEPKELLSKEKYAMRDVTFRGYEYSGFSLPARYPSQFLMPVNITKGWCFSPPNTIMPGPRTCYTKADCNNGSTTGPNYCSPARSGICLGGNSTTQKPCDVNTDCGAGQYCSSNYLVTRRFGVILTPPASCETDSQCPNDGKGRGVCIEHHCYYNPDGGGLSINRKEFQPSCRAYPEADSPFPKDVLDTQRDDRGTPGDGFDEYGNPLSRKLVFKGANVCAQGNDCECTYVKAAYGKGGAYSRYHSWENPNEERTPGMCVGGKAEGLVCDSTSVCTAIDVASSCNFKTNRVQAVGWPGFCIDIDRSLNINSDPNQFACNLWLPVDKLSGAPDIFNQFTEAGFQIPASEANLRYCTAKRDPLTAYGISSYTYSAVNDSGSADANYGGASDDMFSYDRFGCYDPFNPSNTWYAWGHNAQTVCNVGTSDWDTAIVKTTPLRGANGARIKKNDIVAIRIVFHHSKNGNEQTDFWMWPARGANSIFELNWRADRGNCSGEACQNPDSGTATGTNSSTCTNVLQGDHSHCPRHDDSAGNNRCAAAQLTWSGDDLNAVRTVKCVGNANDGPGDHDAPDYRNHEGEVIIYLRAQCTEMSDVGSSSTWPIVNTDTFKRKQNGPVRPYTVAADNTDSSGIDLTPYGHAIPASQITADTFRYGDEHPWSAPLWSGWGGSPHNKFVDGELDHENATAGQIYSRPTGSSRDSQTPSTSQLELLYLYTNKVYRFDDAAQQYVKIDGEFWDKRAAYTSSASAPKVVSVDGTNCAAGTEGLCREKTAGALTVCGGNRPSPVCSETSDVESDIGAGKLKVEIKYYAYADKNHTPLRRKLVDFGDSTATVNSGNSFFKNHRGLDASDNQICGQDQPNNWGLSIQACEPRYFQDIHTYICTTDMISGSDQLPGCSSAKVYPCQAGGACHFKPRVQVLDNWEVCNGVCTQTSHFGNYCMNGDLQGRSQNQECISGIGASADIKGYVLGNPSGYPANKPWTEFAGDIIVHP